MDVCNVHGYLLASGTPVRSRTVYSIIKQLSLSNSSHRGNYRGGYLSPPEQCSGANATEEFQFTRNSLFRTLQGPSLCFQATHIVNMQGDGA